MKSVRRNWRVWSATCGRIYDHMLDPTESRIIGPEIRRNSELTDFAEMVESGYLCTQEVLVEV
jgi:hypothetical protein